MPAKSTDIFGRKIVVDLAGGAAIQKGNDLFARSIEDEKILRAVFVPGRLAKTPEC